MSQDTAIEDREAEASRRWAEALDPSVIDALLAEAKSAGTPIDGADGLLNKMTKAVIERALAAEMTHERELNHVRHEYNTVRLHAGIGYLTPDDEHHGRGEGIHQARRDGLTAARDARINYRRATTEDNR